MKTTKNAIESPEGKFRTNLIEYSLIVELNPLSDGQKLAKDAPQSTTGSYEPDVQFTWPEKVRGGLVSKNFRAGLPNNCLLTYKNISSIAKINYKIDFYLLFEKLF